MMKTYMPHYWAAFPVRVRLMYRAIQSFAMLIGKWRGRGLQTKDRCRHCGAPARRSGGESDRGYCENKLCTNYCPF